MDNQTLIDIASKGEWTLECDRKVLEMMQNLASKIENRATSTSGKMSNMILSLDETRVKMSNLTRINDIKNSVYCENLITDDHLEAINEVPKKTVKLSTDIAIQNGLKLMENSFERHRVNLDPSSARSEIATVYRPIDKFYTPLPYLIGDKNWKEKWHLGLIEEDKFSQTGSVYAESVDSNITSQSRLETENLLASESNLMASQTSLSKSNSSIGDQMIINKQGGLFDEVYSSEPAASAINQPTTSSFFAQQPVERKIVNLFDDEPPELTVESSHNRKAINLFDDVDSVASMPINEPEIFEAPLPPVDIFNDAEFDNFIKKIETDKHKNNNDIPKKEENAVESKNMQANMKSIAAEIKNIHLRKNENVSVVNSTVTKTVQPDKIVAKTSTFREDNKVESRKNSKTESIIPQEVNSKNNNSIISAKPRPRITNLFDDDEDDNDDFFQEVLKQKSQKSESKLSQVKQEEEQPRLSQQKTDKKPINLFDDEDDDDDFDSLFNKTIVPASVSTDAKIFSEKAKGESVKIFESKSSQKINEDVIPSKTHTYDKIADNKQNKKLFDDDEDYKALENDVTNIRYEPSLKSSQESEEIIANNAKETKESNRPSNIMTDNLSNIADSPSTTPISFKINNKVDKIEDSANQFIEINKGELTSTHASDKSIIANCSDDDNANTVPNVITEPELKNIDTSNEIDVNLEQKTNADIFKSSISSRTQQVEKFDNPILFLSDEPPDDDDNWDTEDNNYEEPDVRDIFNRSTSNYLAFNDIPPDDDFNEQPQTADCLDDEEQNGKSSHIDLKEEKIFSESIPASTGIKIPEVDDNTRSNDSSLNKKAAHEENNFPTEPSNKEKKGIDEAVETSIKPIDEKIKSNIQSKLDLFSKSKEDKAIPKESPPKKIPGKLNMNLKINVGALMPGAKVPKKQSSQSKESNESFDNTPSIEELDSSASTDQSSSITDRSSSVAENSSSSGLLNNDITKLRTKIQVKRRPSTRKGRRSIYEQTLSANIEEESKEYLENNVSDNSEIKYLDTVSPPDVMQSIKLSSQEPHQSISHTTLTKNEIIQPKQSDTKALQNEIKTEPQVKESKQIIQQQDVLKLFDDEEPPPIDNSSHVEVKKPVKSISKSRIFYDDEDETRKMLEVEKLKKKEKAKEKSSLWLFDENEDHSVEAVTSKANTEKPESSSNPTKISLFDDDSDNDLFSSSKAIEKPKKIETAKKPVTSKSLFNDDDGEDDIFGITKKKAPEKSSSKVFEDDDDKLDSSILFSKSTSTKPKKDSIFGDDDYDDDDLFNTKPKSSVSKNAGSSTKSSSKTMTKKTTSTAINDPLKDLLDN